MTTYKAGSWNAICDVCGFKFKSDEIKKRWDGLMVCSKDFEHDHPQKYLKIREDKTSTDWVRNRPADVFIETSCDPWSRSPRADYGTADCATVGTYYELNYLFELFGGQTRAIALYAIAGRAIAGLI